MSEADRLSEALSEAIGNQLATQEVRRRHALAMHGGRWYPLSARYGGSLGRWAYRRGWSDKWYRRLARIPIGRPKPKHGGYTVGGFDD